MKRFMRIIPDEDEESPAEIPIIMQEPDKELRPIRTAKSKANLNLASGKTSRSSSIAN